jgi:L-lactate dehydrogenase complex protein LldG
VVGAYQGQLVSAARDEVLRRVRGAVGPSAGAPPVPRAYHRTSELGGDAVVGRFADRVDGYRATVSRVDVAGLPARLAELLAGADRIGVPAGLPAAWLGDLDAVRDDGSLTTVDLDGLDAVVTGCAIAIAETGTIVLDGSPDQGRRALTLVPDHHVCIVPADRIVGSVPEGLAGVEPTRPLTLISGPSATSDIELDRVEGVHGPRRLDVVILVGDAGPARSDEISSS